MESRLQLYVFVKLNQSVHLLEMNEWLNRGPKRIDEIFAKILEFYNPS